jgi:hypothetical protein
MTSYPRLSDALQRLVVDPIKARGVTNPDLEYDIEAIGPLVLVAASQGYELKVTDEVFWATVAAHKREA